jgi:hypothetical protein
VLCVLRENGGARRARGSPTVVCWKSVWLLVTFCCVAGRTGRAGKTGDAYSFIVSEPPKIIRELRDVLIRAKQPVPPELGSVRGSSGGFGRGRGGDRFGGYGGRSDFAPRDAYPPRDLYPPRDAPRDPYPPRDAYPPRDDRGVLPPRDIVPVAVAYPPRDAAPATYPPATRTRPATRTPRVTLLLRVTPTRPVMRIHLVTLRLRATRTRLVTPIRRATRTLLATMASANVLRIAETTVLSAMTRAATGRRTDARR